MSFTPSNEISLSDQFLTIELQLSTQMKALRYNQHVAYIYDPVEYAYNLHAQFTQKFCQSTKKILFLGMNPGPWGMSQTGVPFGEVKVVRDWMRLSGEVGHPIKEHPSRPVLGLACHRSEISGRKFWGLFQELCKEPQHFFQHAFVYNYCPLAFLSSSGKNITPAEFKVVSIPHPSPRNFMVKDWNREATLQLIRLQVIDCFTPSSNST